MDDSRSGGKHGYIIGWEWNRMEGKGREGKRSRLWTKCQFSKHFLNSYPTWGTRAVCKKSWRIQPQEQNPYNQEGYERAGGIFRYRKRRQKRWRKSRWKCRHINYIQLDIGPCFWNALPGMFCHPCLVKCHPISTCNATSSEKPCGIPEGGGRDLSFPPKCSHHVCRGVPWQVL